MVFSVYASSKLFMLSYCAVYLILKSLTDIFALEHINKICVSNLGMERHSFIQNVRFFKIVSMLLLLSLFFLLRCGMEAETLITHTNKSTFKISSY